MALKAFKKKPVEQLNQQVMAKIQQRRLQILVHSCIYYKFDKNIVDDYTYNEWARELARLQEQYPKESAAVGKYYDEFKEWSGEQCGSGFNLPFNNPNVVAKAIQLLKLKGRLI